MAGVRQLIARIDDDLHRRLKERAAAEGVALNALVTRVLEEALSGDDERTRAFSRLEAAGRRVVPPAPAGAPSRDDAVAATRGWGSAVGEALAAQRAVVR